MALTLHGTVSDNTVALDRKTATPLIINGDMAIAQRGTSFTTSGSFPVDRFSVGYGVTGGTFTISQDSTSPADFNNSIKFLVGTGASAGSSEQAYIGTTFEGNNTSHLNFGTSDAKTITLSFRVRSSLTGTFCVALINNAFDRSYIAEYTISSADTWEKKTITFSGDTSGTWVGAVNTRSMLFRFDLGSGSNYNTTAGAWQSGSFRNTSSQTNLVNTSGATFYITGVQLEVGTFDVNSIPPFQFEDRGTSLARCQRYCYKVQADSTGNNGFIANASFGSATNGFAHGHFPTKMRSVPSLSLSGAVGNYAVYRTNGASYLELSALTLNGVSGSSFYLLSFTCASGGVAGESCYLSEDGVTSNESIIFEAEL